MNTVRATPLAPSAPSAPAGGVLETLLEEVRTQARGLEELRVRVERERAAVAYTYERAAELLTGCAYGERGCLSTDTIRRLVLRGYLVRVPNIGACLVTRQSLEELAAAGVPEI